MCSIAMENCSTTARKSRTRSDLEFLRGLTRIKARPCITNLAWPCCMGANRKLVRHAHPREFL